MAKEKTKAQIQRELNAAEIKENGFLNPFSSGVTYDVFLAAKKDASVKEYCKGTLTKEDLTWIELELENVKNNK